SLPADPGGPRCSLSFLTEDSAGDEPLSSTRRSQLEELELGGGCGLGGAWLWPGCPPDSPSLTSPSLIPWPHMNPGGSVLPPHPLASSTRLSATSSQPSSPPGASSSSCSSPTVLLVPRDQGHPQDSPSDPQGSPGSSPTVLLVPGDQGHPQDSPSDPQGSPGSGPTVLLVPGDQGHPQDSPSDPQGSPCAADHLNPRVLEGGSEWQDLLPLGTPEPLGPHSSFSCLPAPRGPSSTAEEPGSPALVGGRRGVLSGPHGADVGLTLLPDTGTATLGHSPELVAALRTGHVPDCAQDELVLAQQFDRPDRSRHWREGLLKSSFNYLLLDPRTTQDLPLRSHRLSPAERFRTFVDAIFYVGKGTRTRPYCHLAEALSQHRAGTQRGCPKVRRILEIWASGQGIISVHCFQNSVPAEAYTRESCLLEALG
ncbi:ANKL1 protein, partial [Aegotheles bennettii]|nr:ANKL1 protein [Aegotheles bennettii]